MSYKYVCNLSWNRALFAAAFNESVMNTPMDCSSFPVLTNGVHPVENGQNHRDDGMQALAAQQPPVS